MLEISPSLENETYRVLIPILDDELVEPTETFTVELLPIGSGAHIETGRGEARVNIIDNDGMQSNNRWCLLSYNSGPKMSALLCLVCILFCSCNCWLCQGFVYSF